MTRINVIYLQGEVNCANVGTEDSQIGKYMQTFDKVVCRLILWNYYNRVMYKYHNKAQFKMPYFVLTPFCVLKIIRVIGNVKSMYTCRK